MDYTTAKTASIKIDVSSDEELNNFLHDAQEYVNKYESYSTAAKEAEEAITKAKTEAES
ncbi:MAG: hypothetical protein K5888_05175 [Lachnospiraceae bacterium]|nr:hypothetical protein [Lachnospiraceae bacterium]